MNRFQEVFTHPHTLLVVIHAKSVDQCVRNAFIARDNGARGAFLINHDISSSELLECYRAVKRPDFWVGLNFLGLKQNEAIRRIPEDADGLWVDHAGIDDSPRANAAREFLIERRARNWSGLYFGGVAFKYQQPVDDLEGVARKAVPFVDVITTSGDATGKAPSVEKIWLMRRGAGDHPIAIASGMTPENVEPYMRHADCFIVATGLSDRESDELIPERIRLMTDKLNP